MATQGVLWEFAQLRIHHKEHHDKEDELLKLLRQVESKWGSH
jgi:hypothetical protein